MALAAETGDMDLHVQVSWWGCTEGRSREGSDLVRACAEWQIVPERRYEYELHSIVN